MEAAVGLRMKKTASQVLHAVRQVIFAQANIFLCTKDVLGTGEQIMRTMFTCKCADRLSKEEDIQTALSDALTKDFLGKFPLFFLVKILTILYKNHRFYLYTTRNR